MNFSELFKQTNQLCCFSPNGKYLANAVQYRLIIRDVQTLQIMQLYTCLDAIQQIEWSPDSEFIVCGMYKRGLVQVWSLEQPEWTCKIDEGSAGLILVTWSPDSRHILTTAEFNLRITVWSIANKSISYIKYPKACQKGMDFSRDGKYMALAERRDCKDHISVFDPSSWLLIKHFETETEDLAGVMWSPDCRVLCVWESCLNYKVLLYSIDGRCLGSYSAYSDALGTKTISWSPTSQFLAVGSYDQKLRLLNHVTWRLIVEHNHPPTIDNKNVVAYREMVNKSSVMSNDKNPPTGVAFGAKSIYEVVEGPIQVPVTKPDLEKANPKLGVGVLEFSADSKYLLSRNDNMPTALWVWDVQTLECAALLIQDAPIRCAKWDPCQSRLAICTGTNKIYMWSPAGSLVVEVPSEASFTVQTFAWHPDGNALLLIGRDQMCVCFLLEGNSDLNLTN